MPLEISSFAIAEKNKVSQASVWLLALKIIIPGEINPVHIVANNEDITWAGQLYQAFNFKISEIGESSRGEVPRVDIQISNVNQLMDYYLDRYNVYIKNSGIELIDVSIMVINSGNLSNPTPEIRHEFQLQQPTTDSQWATFTLGAANPYRQREPVGRALKNQCQHLTGFKGIECGYVGVQTTCNMTLADCRIRENSGHFGGFPGVGDGAINI